MQRFAAVLLATAASAASAQPPAEWNFVVRLDGRPIGTHRFVVTTDDTGATTVASDAHFDVRFLGWSAYRYDHHARERWVDGCLAAIDAKTDDDGQVTTVHSAPLGCLMSFAYWNPRLPAQHRLLDPGTGRIVDVRIRPLPGEHGWRIEGTDNPIEIRWDDKRWIALDTVVGGRRLTYRLE